MGRPRVHFGNVSIDVDLDEVLDGMSDKDFEAAIEARGLGGGINPADLLPAIDALIANRPNAALAVLDALVRPKRSEDFPVAYERAKAARDPETGRPVIS